MFQDDHCISYGTATILGKSNNTVYLLTATHCIFKWNENN